jgi:glycosyltransferase involved in cell wall biosynthesis
VSKYSIVISNYNYGRYISDALESCLKLDRKLLLEIIVVDDGSSDGSEIIIKEFVNKNPLIIKAVFQSNSGQLAALKNGLKIASGEYICLLDADDFYLSSNYLNELNKIYGFTKDIKFVFSDTLTVNEFKSSIPLSGGNDLMIGKTKFLTYFKKYWIGNVTSSISFNRELIRFIGDLDDKINGDWVTRADDIIVFLSSLNDFKKYYLNKKLVGYRVHGRNLYFNKEYSREDHELYRKKKDRLFSIYRDSILRDLSTAALMEEVLSIGYLNKKIARAYYDIIASNFNSSAIKVIFFILLSAKFVYGLFLYKKFGAISNRVCI